MNIGSKAKYPASALSNFAGHRFMYDGVLCNSMEGFLQSLKWKSVEMQEEVCKLVGLGAKRRGYKKNWWTKQELYWKGVAYPRKSVEYEELISSAYDALFYQSAAFRKALEATRGATLTHSIGKSKKNETILTVSEFCGNLHRLQEKLKKASPYKVYDDYENESNN